MKKLLSFLLLVSFFSFYGCSASQGSISITDPKKMAKIKIHQSTKEDVKAILGKPNNVTIGNDKEVWTYNYFSSNMNGMVKKEVAGYGLGMLIPGIGGIVANMSASSTLGHNNSGIKHKSISLRLTFDSNGVLINKVFSKTE